MNRKTLDNQRIVWILATAILALALAGRFVPRLLAQDESAKGTTTQTAKASDELVKPPLELVLHINGKEHNALLDQPMKVRVGDRTLDVKVTAKAHRTFRAAGVEFQYPRYCAFEVEHLSSTLTMWALDGNDVVIMVLHASGESDADAFRDSSIESTREQFGDATASVVATSTKLGGRTVKGKRLTAHIASTEIRQETFAFRHSGGVVSLIIQDSFEGDGVSPELAQVRKMLASSFKLIP